ncbi:Pentatricopeptide repeat-containing protein [Seminavis robusta]|uniref:Pentatricopeptide repeat-containing protein n=1 Tax=Seminavis robusta TaxID=568900 RepID=A0A9N8DXZ3_9STRA|nr:Pentatricopeptide repeat-containing protein [Seminavis robusta]|eukprot:Sro434_g142130.1 Pentatricopeptide repeat-containing protein (851) ;mRNA; f:52178-54730
MKAIGRKALRIRRHHGRVPGFGVSIPAACTSSAALRCLASNPLQTTFVAANRGSDSSCLSSVASFSTSTREEVEDLVSDIPCDDDDDDDTTEQLLKEISVWARNRQPQKAQHILEERTRHLKMSESDLTKCYNCILLGWSVSRDVDAAEMAQQVLESMPVPPSLISLGYVLESWSKSKLRKRTSKLAGQRAEQLLRKMQSMGLQDQQQAYHNALKACAKGADGYRALKLLRELVQLQLKSDNPLRLGRHVLSTVLMALKSQPQEAEELLESLHNSFGVKPDVVHYAIVLDAWANNRNPARVEALINRMMVDGIKVDASAYNSLLHASRDNLDRMEALFRAMVDDYIQCPYRDNNNTNDLDDKTAAEERSSAPIGSAVKPTVEGLGRVLAAMAHNREPHRAEALLQTVINDTRVRSFLQPNLQCFSSVINAWARAKQPQRAEDLLRHIQNAGYDVNIVVYTTVMHGWAIVGNVQRAQALWIEILNHDNLRPNLNTLNTLLLAYSNARPKPQPEQMDQVMRRAAEESNVKPDTASYTMLLRAWVAAGRPEKARALLDELREKEQIESSVLLDTVTFNTVLHAYSKGGLPMEAEELLSMMLQNVQVEPNAQTFALVLSAYTRSKNPKHKQKSVKRAEELVEKMEEMDIAPNGHLFNVMLNCYSTSGFPERAEAVLKQMIERNATEVDVVSYNTCLYAWARAGCPHRAEHLLLYLATHDSGGRPPLDVQSFSIVMFGWAKQGTVESAKHCEEILRHMQTLEPSCKPDQVSYNTVLRSWLNVGLKNSENHELCLRCAERADILLSELEKLYQTQPSNQFRPDRLSFTPVIRLWKMGQNGERAKQVEARARDLRVL